MLKIRQEQMEVLEKAALRNFEAEMVDHGKMYDPKLCQVLGDEQVRLAVRKAMDSASEYGFTLRGPIRLFIEMIFLFGSHFDTDPQYPWAGDILRGGETKDQMEQAEQLYNRITDYLENVSGQGNMNEQRALENLSILARKQVVLPAANIDSILLGLMSRIFPQKAAYVGEEALIELINEAKAEAGKFGLDTSRGLAITALLMFACGHGCTDDPLFPWISRTLLDEKIIDSTARADRLERKSVTWLENVLAKSS